MEIRNKSDNTTYFVSKKDLVFLAKYCYTYMDGYCTYEAYSKECPGIDIDESTFNTLFEKHKPDLKIECENKTIFTWKENIGLLYKYGDFPYSVYICGHFENITDSEAEKIKLIINERDNGNNLQ